MFSSSVDEVEYPFSVKGKCLSGPPPPASRWSLLGYLAQKASLLFMHPFITCTLTRWTLVYLVKIFLFFYFTDLSLSLSLQLGGNFCYEPEDMVGSNGTEDCPLSNATQQLLRERVFNDLVIAIATSIRYMDYRRIHRI